MALTEEHLQGDRTELNVQLNDLRRRIANGGEYTKDEVAIAIRFFHADANHAQAASTQKKTAEKPAKKSKVVPVDLSEFLDKEI